MQPVTRLQDVNFKPLTPYQWQASTQAVVDMARVKRLCYEKLNPGTIYDGMWTGGEQLREDGVFQPVMNHLRKAQKAGATLVSFIGTTGTGKTCAALVGAIDAMAVNAKDGFEKAVRETGVGRRVVEGMFATMGMISRSSGHSNAEALKALMNTPVLVMDDLRGKEEGQTSKAFIGLIDELIDHRYRHQKTTFITSNLSVPAFKDTYGDRVISRLSASGYLAPCNGQDLRKAKR